MVPSLLHEILTGQSKFEEPALVSAASSIFTGTHCLHSKLYMLKSDLTASILIAATDTTTAVLSNFLILITTHPEAQRKAFQEILDVVGTSRLPSLADQPDLPYLHAMMREVHRFVRNSTSLHSPDTLLRRFNPVTPVIPRSPIREDHYEGMRIPENTWAMFNIW